MNQGQSEIHDPGREGEAGEGGGSALQPQEGKASAARAVPASLHRQSLPRNCPAPGAPEGRWDFLLRPQALVQFIVPDPTRAYVASNSCRAHLWIVLPVRVPSPLSLGISIPESGAR